MDKILLIDGMNAVNRANVSFGPRVPHAACNLDNDYHTDKHIEIAHCQCGAEWDEEYLTCYGDKYNIIYMFFRSLRAVVEQFSPDKCFFVLEGHPQFRYDLFPEYKANRIIKRGAKQDQYDRVIDSANHIVELLSKLPITVARAANYECDDTIGTLCENMREEDLTVLSNDGDYTQLLQRKYNSVKVYNPIKKTNMVAPDYHFILFRTLVGDKSDDIKRLISDKKAKEICADPKKLEEFLSNEENRSNFNINRQLVEFRHVPEEDIEIKEGVADFEGLKNSFAGMRFKSMLNEEYWSNFIKTFDCIKF